MTGQLADTLAKVVAELLIELSGELERLGESLCKDAALVRQHMTQLQKIDVIAQKQRSIAQVLGSDCPARAVEALGLDGLKERLRI